MGPGDVGLDYTIQYRRRVRCACLLSMTHGPGLDSMLGRGWLQLGRKRSDTSKYAAKVDWQDCPITRACRLPKRPARAFSVYRLYERAKTITRMVTARGGRPPCPLPRHAGDHASARSIHDAHARVPACGCWHASTRFLLAIHFPSETPSSG